jgi:LAO/AO transport system kinase
MHLAERAAAGERLAIARLLTLIENGTDEGLEALDQLYPRSGSAHLIGITGPSGAGKSTLVNRLALALVDLPEQRDAALRVAVIAIDPTSPFSGGALLGDRIRMRDLADRPDIFIRSMATRGTLGGLARAAGEAALLLDAAGFKYVLIETVGAGQAEVDIARLAHTTLVIEAPGLGDDVQAGKAGILEIADILVVNKADKPGADAAARALELMLEIGDELRNSGQQPNEPGWHVPVLKVSALNGDGIADLIDSIQAHRNFLKTGSGWQARGGAYARSMFDSLLHERLFAGWQAGTDRQLLEGIYDRMANRALSPRQALRELGFK